MMKRFTSSTIANYLVALVLVLVPFHAFLTVYASQLVGHYTLLRLWDDIVLLIVAGIAASWVVRETRLRQWLAGSLLVRLIAAYALLTVLLGVISYVKGDVSGKALGYGLLVNLRFLAWFLVVLLAAQRSSWLRSAWPKLLVGSALVVIAFGALQYTVLPHNFLAHFGYNSQTTIAPIETINHNGAYIRVQSTLRGANPLGAYLVVVLCAVGVLLLRSKRRILCAVLGVLGLFVLYASGSRSAWLATVLSLAILAWLVLATRRARTILAVVVAGFVVLAAGGYVLLQHSAGLQNAVLHTQTHSKIAVSSNAAHASALSSGVRDVLHQPLGDGPGTAGPASEYNSDGSSRIAEDYYVQVAQETGWLGLALLLAIFALITVELYGVSQQSRLALVLYISFIGLTVVNLLSHAWTDDTLAFVWWGYAGIALGRPLPKQTTKRKDSLAAK